MRKGSNRGREISKEIRTGASTGAGRGQIASIGKSSRVSFNFKCSSTFYGIYEYFSTRPIISFHMMSMLLGVDHSKWYIEEIQ